MECMLILVIKESVLNRPEDQSTLSSPLSIECLRIIYINNVH